jgi:hypothetical protein
MRLFKSATSEEEIKKQEEEIMAAGQAVEEWHRLNISMRIMENLNKAEASLKEGLFEFDSKEYYRAQGSLKTIKSIKELINSPLAERDMLIAQKQEEGWNE